MEDIAFVMRRTQLDEVPFDLAVIRTYLGCFGRTQRYFDVPSA